MDSQPAPGTGQTGSGCFGEIGPRLAPYVLCRSLDVWKGLSCVSLPGQIRWLLEATYCRQPERGLMARYLQELDCAEEKLRRMALGGVSRGGKTLPEARATTRYSELETTELLLLRCCHIGSLATRIEFRDGREMELPANPRQLPAVEWRKRAAALQWNSLTLPEYLSPETARCQIQWAEDYACLGDEEENSFRVALIEENGALRGLDGSPEPNRHYLLDYHPRIGLRAVQRSPSCCW